MTDQVEEIKGALEEIKASVTEKMENAVSKEEAKSIADEAIASLTIKLDTKAAVEEIEKLNAELEALQAKFDNLPAPAVIKKEEKAMNVHDLFTKAFEEKGKYEAEIELKGITQSASITGAPVETYGLSGSAFAGNPVRLLASTIEVASDTLILPVRTGVHGAAVANTATKALTAGGNTAITEVSVAVKSIEALSEVTVEAASDIIGFDQFWTQDMLDEVASIEAAQHVTAIEAMSGVTAAANTALALSDLADLHFSVAPQYRAGASFMVSTDAMSQIRTLNTSSTGGDLVFDAQLGVFRLFGKPIYENAYMADVAASAVVAAFGDFKKGFVIANRANATVARYEQTKPGYFSYYAKLRAGSSAWHSAALKTLTMKA